MTSNQLRWLRTKDQRNAKRRVPPELKKKGGAPKGPRKVSKEVAILAAIELLQGKTIRELSQPIGVQPDTLTRALNAYGIRKAVRGNQWIKIPEGVR